MCWEISVFPCICFLTSYPLPILLSSQAWRHDSSNSLAIFIVNPSSLPFNNVTLTLDLSLYEFSNPNPVLYPFVLTAINSAGKEEELATFSTDELEYTATAPLDGLDMYYWVITVKTAQGQGQGRGHDSVKKRLVLR